MNTKLNTDEGLGAQAAQVTRGKASERRDWFGWFGHRRCVSFLWFGRRRLLPAAIEVFVRRSLPAFVQFCERSLEAATAREGWKHRSQRRLAEENRCRLSAEERKKEKGIRVLCFSFFEELGNGKGDFEGGGGLTGGVVVDLPRIFLSVSRWRLLSDLPRIFLSCLAADGDEGQRRDELLWIALDPVFPQDTRKLRKPL